MRHIATLFAAALLLAACVQAEPTPTGSPAVATAESTETPAPTLTPLPTATPLPAAGYSLTPALLAGLGQVLSTDLFAAMQEGDMLEIEYDAEGYITRFLAVPQPDGTTPNITLPEGTRIPLSFLDFFTEIELASPDHVDFNAASEALPALPSAGYYNVLLGTLDGTLVAYTPFDAPDAPRYAFQNRQWQDQHLGRAEVERYYPPTTGAGRSIWMEMQGMVWDEASGGYSPAVRLGRALWSPEYMAYQRQEPETGETLYFYPGLGTSGDLALADIEQGWTRVTERIQTEDFQPGVRGLDLAFAVSARHPTVAGIELYPEVRGAGAQVLLRRLLGRYPQLHGRTLIVQLTDSPGGPIPREAYLAIPEYDLTIGLVTYLREIYRNYTFRGGHLHLDSVRMSFVRIADRVFLAGGGADYGFSGDELLFALIYTLGKTGIGVADLGTLDNYQSVKDALALEVAQATGQDTRRSTHYVLRTLIQPSVQHGMQDVPATIVDPGLPEGAVNSGRVVITATSIFQARILEGVEMSGQAAGRVYFQETVGMIDIDSGILTPLFTAGITQDRGVVPEVRLSPDGRQIAHGGYSIYLTPTSGGSTRKLLGGSGGPFYGRLAWSPDGAQLAVGVHADRYLDPHYEVHVVDVESAETVVLAPVHSAWPADPQWSPDGALLAFTAGPEGQTDIWVAAPDGSALRNLTEQVETPVHSPLWLPDGEQIMLAGCVDESCDVSRLFLLDIDTPGVLVPVEGTEDTLIHSPSLSPDGTRVAWIGEGSTLNIAGIDGSSRLIYGVGVIERSSHPYVWSPDGEFITYFSDGTYIYYVDLRSGQVDRTPLPLEYYGIGALDW